MQLQDITADTARAFFTCLHLEEPEDLAWTEHRRQWYAAYKDRGYRAQVLVLDDGTVVGKCHSLPIEHSPFVGRDLLAILCIYVHMYGHHIGDQRHQGYGRFMLDRIEQDARASGFKGVVAWAMDWDSWNPVSFYEHMGYTRIDQEDKVVVVWKPFCADAEPPGLLRLDSLPGEGRERVNVLVADNAWCDSKSKLVTAREAIEGIEHMVEYTEVGSPWCDRIIHLGHVGGVFLDGRAYRPYQLIGGSEELRAEIIRLYGQKPVEKVVLEG
jgi:N-acetylglutamate synthase-like GNAT family acetyltransferase